jgi:hypothetical protein
MDEKTPSLKILQGTELLDTLENKGLRSELNRVMLNPIGLDLNIAADGTIYLQATNSPYGIVKSRIDHFKRTAFRSYSETKFNARQRQYGFIIQTKDMYNAEKMNDESTPIAPPTSVRLGIILSLLDQVFYLCKQRVMDKSNSRDEKWWQTWSENDLIGNMYSAIMEGRFTDLINYAAMLIGVDDFKKAIEKLISEYGLPFDDVAEGDKDAPVEIDPT